MPIITPRQCKAARHLLAWTQEDLAAASNVGLSTIGSFENENKDAKTKTPRVDSINLISAAFEMAGIEFLDGQGVKLRCQNTKTYQGLNACHDFFEDMLKELKANNGDILVYIRLQDLLTKYSGERRTNNLQRLIELHEITDVKCILSDPRPPSFAIPTFDIKVVPKAALSPVSFFVYGNKMAFIYLDARMEFTILAVYEAPMAQEYKNIFSFYWDAAPFIKFPSSRFGQQAEIALFA